MNYQVQQHTQPRGTVYSAKFRVGELELSTFARADKKLNVERQAYSLEMITN